jgi:hypothetical protein
MCGSFVAITRLPHELSLSLPGEYRAAAGGFQKSKSNDPLRGRNVGQTMLLPIVILAVTMSPLLIPALVTAFHLVANRLRNSDESVTVVRRPITALATDG